MDFLIDCFRETKKLPWACPSLPTWIVTIRNWPNYKSLLLITWWLRCVMLMGKLAFCPESGMTVSKMMTTKAFQVHFTVMEVDATTTGGPVQEKTHACPNWKEILANLRALVAIPTPQSIENGLQQVARFFAYRLNIFKRIMSIGWPR